MYFRFCLSIALLGAVSLATTGCDNTSASDKSNGANNTAAIKPATHAPVQAPRDLVSQVTGSPPVAVPPSTPKAGPAFFAEKSTFDIGTVWMGTKVPITLTYKNVGTELLRILEVKPGCGCTQPTQDYTKEVPPGGEGRMPLVLDTTNKPNGHMHNIDVKVKTNDPARPEVVFTLTGNIRTVCVFDPPIGGVVGEWQPDQSINRTVKMYNNTGAPLTLELQPIPPTSFFKIDFREVVPNQQWEFTMTHDAPIPEGSNYTPMAFRTNVPEVPVYNVPVSVMVHPRIQVTPPTLVVNPVKPEAVPREIRIINNGRTPVNVVGVATNRPEFNVSLVPPGPPAPGTAGYFATKSYLTHTINLTLPPNYQPPPWGDVIQITTDDAAMPVIDVNILTYFLQAGQKPTARPPEQPFVLTPIKMPGK